MASNSSSSREEPTILWATIKGNKVKSNDGKDLGEIKEVSQNFLRLEKGTVKKTSFGFQNMLLMLMTVKYYGF